MTAPTRSWTDTAAIVHEGPLLTTHDGCDVIECGACSFKHLVPIPSDEQLTAEYENDYYAEEKPHYFERHREDLDWWNLAYGDRYDVLEERLPSNRRRLLDIGSGPGYFLLHGRDRGWDVKGIEPSRQAAEHSSGLGLDVDNDFYSEETAPSLGRFDAVNMSEVLEHIPDPAAFLGLVHRHLNEDGMLCVVVPNDYNPFQIALRDQLGFEPWWVSPHHINYFDFGSLESLFERCGFDVVHKEATFPIDMFLLMGDNYVGDDDLGRVCHGKRKTFEFNLAAAGMAAVKRDLYEKIADSGLGREIILFGRRR